MIKLETNKEVYELFKKFYPDVEEKLKEAFHKQTTKKDTNFLKQLLTDSVTHLHDEQLDRIEMQNAPPWQR